MAEKEAKQAPSFASLTFAHQDATLSYSRLRIFLSSQSSEKPQAACIARVRPLATTIWPLSWWDKLHERGLFCARSPPQKKTPARGFPSLCPLGIDAYPEFSCEPKVAPVGGNRLFSLVLATVSFLSTFAAGVSESRGKSAPQWRAPARASLFQQTPCNLRNSSMTRNHVNDATRL